MFSLYEITENNCQENIFQECVKICMFETKTFHFNNKTPSAQL